MEQGELTASVVKYLSSYLKVECPSLKNAYENFPNPSQVLEYPSLTIINAGKSVFTPYGDQYVIYKGDVIDSGEDIGKFPVRRVVGNHVFNFQLDFWCSSKPERHAIFKEFFNAFNKDTNAMGLSLQMEDYYNTFAHYSITDLDTSDSEDQSQRSEWRIKIGLVVDCMAVIERNELLIQTIENTLETPNVIPAPVPEDDGVSII